MGIVRQIVDELMDRMTSKVPLEGAKILQIELRSFKSFPSGLLCFELMPGV